LFESDGFAFGLKRAGDFYAPWPAAACVNACTPVMFMKMFFKILSQSSAVNRLITFADENVNKVKSVHGWLAKP
jgi:hypothetical protein